MGARYWRGVFEYLCRKPRLGRSGWMCVCGFNAMVCVYRSAYDIRQSNGTFGIFFADRQSYGVNDSAPYASACPSWSVYQRSFACVYIGRICAGRYAKRAFSRDCSTRADAFFFGRIYKAAGIYDDDVGARDLGRDLVVLQASEHDLGVH